VSSGSTISAAKAAVAPSGAKGGDNAPGYTAIRFNMDWITRPLFGIALAFVVIAAVFGGRPIIAVFGAIAAIAAVREWHRLIGERVFGPAFILSSITIAASLTAIALWPKAWIAWAILASGAVIVGVYAALAYRRPFWHGAGPLYVAIAPMALVVMRDAPHGAVIIIGMFLAIWATDTGALIVGNLAGGPKLWPALSPNKTWSGTLGAVVLAALVEAGFVAAIGGQPLLGGLYGAGLAVVAHGGDLFESWVKRAFHRKDSGGLIPGHGGVLDRIDSTLLTAPVLAILVVLGFNPLFGVHS
jgi:phosphatidate cytidylyltransferase